MIEIERQVWIANNLDRGHSKDSAVAGLIWRDSYSHDDAVHKRAVASIAFSFFLSLHQSSNCAQNRECLAAQSSGILGPEQHPETVR